MTDDVALTNARLVVPELGVVQGSLVIRDGIVAEIRQGSEPIGTHDVIDAEGRYVLPGLLDAHVHYGLLPPLAERMAAESAFAASGGVTTVLRYFRRPESYLETFPAQVQIGVEHQYQDFTHHLALYTAEQVSEMEQYVRDFGVTSFKLYMNLKGEFGHNFLMDLRPEHGDQLSTADVDFDDGHLFDVFQTAARLPMRVRINIHAENAEIVMHETTRTRELGLDGLPAWNAARPQTSEALAIQQVAHLSRHFRVPIYFPHIGSREAVDAIAEVRRLGTDYAAETCPQYVALTVESDAGPLAKVMPPVRTDDDVQHVWWAIAQGLITSLGSDHIAYSLEEKQPGSIWTTRPAFGGTGLILPVFLSEGVNQERLTLRRLATISSAHTAKTFGLYPRKGTLLPGSDADFVIIDPDHEWTVRAAALPSASDFSTYEGLRLHGAVVLTAVRGTVVYRDGQIVGSPGHGRYYRRYPAIRQVDTVGT